MWQVLIIDKSSLNIGPSDGEWPQSRIKQEVSKCPKQALHLHHGILRKYPVPSQ